jgi:membrane protein DedA with SNARE-associated domain
VAQAKEYFATRHTKAVATAKLIHGIGFTGLIIAGSLHVPYRKFIQVCATITLGQSLVFLIIGLLFGRLYTVLSGYFNYYAAGISVVVLTLIVITIYRNLRKEKP